MVETVEHLIRQLRERGFQDDAEFTEEVLLPKDKLAIVVPREILTDTALTGGYAYSLCIGNRIICRNRLILE